MTWITKNLGFFAGGQSQSGQGQSAPRPAMPPVGEVGPTSPPKTPLSLKGKTYVGIYSIEGDTFQISIPPVLKLKFVR